MEVLPQLENIIFIHNYYLYFIFPIFHLSAAPPPFYFYFISIIFMASIIKPKSRKTYSLIQPLPTEEKSYSSNIFRRNPFKNTLFPTNFDHLNIQTPIKSVERENKQVDVSSLKYTKANLLKIRQKSQPKEPIKIEKQEVYRIDVDKKQGYTRVHRTEARNKKSFSTGLKRQGTYLKDFRRLAQKNQDFYDFRGFVGEIASKKTIREQLGDQYFEYSLRDRHKDEKKSQSYMYCIVSGQRPSAFMKKLHRFHPQIKAKRKMILRGRHVVTQN